MYERSWSIIAWLFVELLHAVFDGLSHDSWELALHANQRSISLVNMNSSKFQTMDVKANKPNIFQIMLYFVVWYTIRQESLDMFKRFSIHATFVIWWLFINQFCIINYVRENILKWVMLNLSQCEEFKYHLFLYFTYMQSEIILTSKEACWSWKNKCCM